ncbi:IS1182 family transposase [Chlorobium phaeovibrioides]|uniref:IS1182 family transposase n=1 Tax=Chlorobium phaeovibrioides TaxID=1094 RepID=A0A5M8I9D8_CHLPH|nr:IS1182 family transposase [Chlorobium phaeovibrioides]KAA6232086.1 IS1182 family transposase [Chlorobium phaeovibrioides]MDT9547442.1 IS1182 family transposase [Chlorobium phaeovibrioides]
MRVDFVLPDRDTPFLFPPSVQEWLPQDHLARFVVDIVAQLDLSSLRSSYAGRGSNPYDPSMLLALLVYGYATGVSSSRKLEQATYDSVAFRYITGNQHPDHDTISGFRQRFSTEVKKHFTRVLVIAGEMGLLRLGTVSLDGTKLKANASKHQAMSWQHACALEKKLKAEVEQLWRVADQADNTPVADGMSIPEELTIREKRLETIAEVKKKIDQRAKERYEQEKAAYDQKIADREQKKKNGKRGGGKPPKAPEPGPRPKDQVNLTDEESRIMPAGGGGFVQAYNAQGCVDSETMLIVATNTTQQPNDKLQIKPALAELAKLPEVLGKVKQVIADTGYYSASNVNACEAAGIDPLIAVSREAHNQSLEQRFSQPGPLAKDADAVTRMQHRLQTRNGKEIYAKRKCTVEPVFGIIKSVLGHRQLLRRGFRKAQTEWDLISIAWNLKRMHVLAILRPKKVERAALMVTPAL